MKKVQSARRGRPTKAEAERLQVRILETALMLFTEHGFAVSMEAIATAARVSTRTLYARYPDKLGLFKGVLGWLSAERTQPALRLPADMPMQDALRRYGMALHEHYCTPHILTFLRLVEKEKERLPELDRVQREELNREQILPLKQYFDAQPTGKLRDVNTFIAAQTFVRDAISQIGMGFARGDATTKDEMDAFLTEVINILSRGLLSES